MKAGVHPHDRGFKRLATWGRLILMYQHVSPAQINLILKLELTDMGANARQGVRHT